MTVRVEVDETEDTVSVYTSHGWHKFDRDEAERLWRALDIALRDEGPR